MLGLFDPLTIRSVTLGNRVGVSPMCQYSSRDGFVSRWHLVHLGGRAIGGAGLVMVEATAVEADGRISPDDLGLWKDEHIPPLAEIAEFISEHGSVPGIQLAHAGRKAGRASPWKGDHSLADHEGGWQPVAPSAIAYGGWVDRVPRSLSVPEIGGITASFAAAAKRAANAGFRWLELHAAHGYLIHSFLSPISNRRTDSYGGSFENRIRLLLETVRALRSGWPDNLPLAVRLSSTEWTEGGWTLEDTISLATHLKEEGVDLIDCSSSPIAAEGARIAAGPGFQVPFAEAVRSQTGLATAAVGMIDDAHQADAIIRKGQADLILLGRAELRDPYWPYRAARTLKQAEAIRLPTPYAYWLPDTPEQAKALKSV